MEVEVALITRRGSASRRGSHRVNVPERIRFGRDAANEVPLRDLRVELLAAALLHRGDRLIVERLGTSPLFVNGNSTDRAEVAPGDKIRIGPYALTVTPPSPGCDAAITVELIEPVPGGLAAATARSPTDLDAVMPSLRVAAWAGFVFVAIFCLAAPVLVLSVGIAPVERQRGSAGRAALEFFALSWSSGAFANPHRYFAVDCRSCHRTAFAGVSDGACLSCHNPMPGHFPAAASVGPFREQIEARRCTACHPEHRGPRGMLLKAERLCLACHRTLADAAPAAGTRDVTGFPAGHPQFRATVVRNPITGTLARIAVDGDPSPVDRPAIKFAHAVHLVKDGFPALGDKPLRCGDCHVLEPGGKGFLPVTYKDNCRRCHSLTFDRADLPWPKATVPHGEEAGLIAAVWNFYAGVALAGGIAAPGTAPPLRRAPGSEVDLPGAARPQDPLALIRRRAAAALDTVILDRAGSSGCFKCHYPASAKPAFDAAALLPPALGQPPAADARIVAPVRLLSRFLPNARFDHAKHSAVACGDCHRLRFGESQVALSQLGKVMASPVVPEPLDIPGKTNCARCHGTSDARHRAETTCITCHVFHRAGSTPMRALPATAP